MDFQALDDRMKLNLGCGQDYRQGWINVDRQPEVRPDVIWDLAAFPWPFETASADEVALIHLLDETPVASILLPQFMQELYRICRDGATITIRNTDPGHADAALAPQATSGVVMTAFQSYDLVVNEDWISRGLRHTPSALYAKVDFTTATATRFLDDRWLNQWRSGALGDDALTAAMLGQNNVVVASEVVLKTRKPFSPGRSLAQCDAIVLTRWGGLGDVLMALSACKALKAVVDRPIYLVTAPSYRSFAELCPHVDGVFSDQSALMAHVAAAGQTVLKSVDLSPVRFGLSRLHEVDTFLQALSVTPADDAKGLDIDLSGVAPDPEVTARLAALPPGCRKIVLHPGLSDPNRTWPAQFWRDLADHCIAEGHSVVVIGRSHSQDGKGVAKLGDGRVVDFTDGLDLAASLQVLRACDLLISADSGPIQLAGASDIAIVGLYSVVGGENRLPYRSGSMHHKAVGIGPDCAWSPCYRWMSDPGVHAEFLRSSGTPDNDVTALCSRGGASIRTAMPACANRAWPTRSRPSCPRCSRPFQGSLLDRGELPDRQTVATRLNLRISTSSLEAI